MKKLLAILFFAILISSFAISEKFQIDSASFDIAAGGFEWLGKTQPNILLMKYPLDKTIVFESEEDFNKYLENYEKQLLSSRAFDKLEITVNKKNTEDDITKIDLGFVIQDSHHFLIMPYPKYSSNDGLSLKLKVKDSNFAGTLNTLSSELNLQLDNNGKLSPGLSVDYVLPFQIGNVNSELVNEHSISYTTGDSMPQWSMKTGVNFLFPFKTVSLKLEAYQYFINNLDYLPYKDNMYFTEEFTMSLPISIFSFENFTKLYYTPFISFNFNWDFDGIDIKNNSLASPNVIFGQSLSNSKILWDNCFRYGYNVSLTNKFTYNIQRNDFIPYVGFEGLFYYTFKTSETRNFFDQFGICADFYAFTYMYAPGNSYIYGEKIGSRLRGVLDNSYLGNVDPKYTTSTAVVVSIDLPHHIFTTHFNHEIFNFDFQISPFIDVALIQDRENNSFLSIKKGIYCAGVEFLVYPLKWSSYTIRASAGYDVKKLLKGEAGIKEGIKHPEIFIGIGHQY